MLLLLSYFFFLLLLILLLVRGGEGMRVSIVVDMKFEIRDLDIIKCPFEVQEDICLGGLCGSGDLPFDGDLDQLILFSKVLSIQEINVLNSFPQCPSFCDQCEQIDNKLNCSNCLGDR